MAKEAPKKSVEDRMATMEKVIEDQARTIAKLKAPKGIQSAREKNKPKKVELTSDQKAERELRRYIVRPGVIRKIDSKKQPGRFRKNLSEEKKERARYLMKLLGRTKMDWSEDLLDVKNHQPHPEGEQS